MARNMYGATSADFTLTSGGRPVPGAELTIWDARTGGTQITDLLDVDSVACTTVTSDAAGAVVYYGPDSDKTVHWADSGQGARVAIRPVDITGDPPVISVGTVTTGTAGATLTGTSEAPVLNLVLPSAGANGVNTAAIQDSAVTSAKIAADTITAANIASNAVGSSELADNAVDTAALADGSVTTAKIANDAVTTAKIADGTIVDGDINAAAGIARTKIAGTAVSLSELAAAQASVDALAARMLSGTAAPEGTVSAALGSTYLQTTGAATVTGMMSWRKTSGGTGNTGWTPEGALADTGWRLVTALMESAFKTSNPSFSLLLRRVGSRVTYACNETVAGSATGTVTIYNAPAGFRETVRNLPQYTDLANANTGGGTHETLALNANTLSGFGWTAIRHVGHLTFDLSDGAAWPSSLPGSAA